jgi:hypothetical protein
MPLCHFASDEGQTIQWPKVKGQKDKQWSTHKTKDRVTRTPLSDVSAASLFTGRLFLSGTNRPPAEVSTQW